MLLSAQPQSIRTQLANGAPQGCNHIYTYTEMHMFMCCVATRMRLCRIENVSVCVSVYMHPSFPCSECASVRAFSQYAFSVLVSCAVGVVHPLDKLCKFSRFVSIFNCSTSFDSGQYYIHI